jgi:hypothetical protein
MSVGRRVIFTSTVLIVLALVAAAALVTGAFTISVVRFAVAATGVLVCV